MLSGCAPDASNGKTIPTSQYTGPHAQDFSYWAEREGTPDFALAAMADSHISEAELAEAESRFVACTSKHGILVSHFDPLGGTYETGPLNDTGPMGSLADVDVCELSSGYLPLMFIYMSVTQNPENRDNSEIMTECLIRNKALAPDYPVEQFAHDNEHLSLPFKDPLSGERIFDSCTRDPLGHNR